MIVFAIDPGTTESAFVLCDDVKVERFGKLPNAEMLVEIDVTLDRNGSHINCAIEEIESFGMAVGKEVFATCRWLGRFQERWHAATGDVYTPVLIPRRTVKSTLCHSMKAKDGNIRAALIDRFGGLGMAIGRKATPGPLYGISGDVWSALAIAVTYQELHA